MKTQWILPSSQFDYAATEQVKRTKDLGWLLRNWQKVSSLQFNYFPQVMDGELVASLKQGGLWASDFASLSVCWHWLDRPVFRGLLFRLRQAERPLQLFTVGDAAWKRLDAMAYAVFMPTLVDKWRDGE